MADYDVVVSGAGVAGLTLAVVLGRQGARVLVVDKQTRPRSTHKGEVLQPRSLQILDQLEALEPLLAGGALPAQRLVSAAASGEELMALDYRTLAGEFRHCLVQHYPDICTSLEGSLPPSVELARGRTVEDLLRAPDGRVAGVRVREPGARRDLSAALTVAADGSGSRLRRLAGIDSTLRRYDHQLVALELHDPGGLGSDIVTYLTVNGVRVLYRLPHGRARLYVQIPTGAFQTVGRRGLPDWVGGLAESFPALAPWAGRLPEQVVDVQVMPAIRLSTAAWTRPGLVLLGDAAHCVHPMVGQGMNAAIADAWALGTELAEVDWRSAAAADAATRRYEQARRPTVDYVLRLSHNLATLFTGTSLAARTVWPFMLRRNSSNLRLRHQLTRNVAGLDARPFGPWDWLVASGLVPDPWRTRVPTTSAA
jgi:2-polyprenyl-6-methoxyphenol hydroxylase-like FAD-dependent oxidoreductase